LLTATNLTKRFKSKLALQNVDCVLEPGTITVVVGPNGSGKTTLLRAMALLDPPDSGSITVDSALYRFPVSPDVRLQPPWPQVTVVFQQLFLWPHLTLRENILMPARRRKIQDSAGKFQRIVSTLEMDDFVDRYPNQTSAGQRQRAATARALMLEPSYLLLDEVTSALDVHSTALVLNYLLTLRGSGVGILLISHMLGFAQRAADQILFMDGGRVIESGGKDVLQNSGNPRVQRFVELVKGGQ
jgi:ABC-type polar amino acid transport system ATPase subunit